MFLKFRPIDPQPKIEAMLVETADTAEVLLRETGEPDLFMSKEDFVERYFPVGKKARVMYEAIGGKLDKK